MLRTPSTLDGTAACHLLQEVILTSPESLLLQAPQHLLFISTHLHPRPRYPGPCRHLQLGGKDLWELRAGMTAHLTQAGSRVVTIRRRQPKAARPGSQRPQDTVQQQ